MNEFHEHTTSNAEDSQSAPDNGNEPLEGSGFEEEQPETDFDERM